MILEVHSLIQYHCRSAGLSVCRFLSSSQWSLLQDSECSFLSQRVLEKVRLGLDRARASGCWWCLILGLCLYQVILLCMYVLNTSGCSVPVAYAGLCFCSVFRSSLRALFCPLSACKPHMCFFQELLWASYFPDRQSLGTAGTWKLPDEHTRALTCLSQWSASLRWASLVLQVRLITHWPISTATHLVHQCFRSGASDPHSDPSILQVPQAPSSDAWLFLSTARSHFQASLCLSPCFQDLIWTFQCLFPALASVMKACSVHADAHSWSCMLLEALCWSLLMSALCFSSFPPALWIALWLCLGSLALGVYQPPTLWLSDANRLSLASLFSHLLSTIQAAPSSIVNDLSVLLPLPKVLLSRLLLPRLFMFQLVFHTWYLGLRHLGQRIFCALPLVFLIVASSDAP